MRVLLFVPLIFAAVFATGSLHAVTVNVTATGIFSDYSDPSGLLPFSMPAAGTEFTLTISYDDQTSDALPGNPKVGLYLNTVSSSTLVISSEPFTATGTGNIVIIDDALTDDGTNYGDIWQTFSSVSSAGITEDSIGLLLINPQPELPVTPLTSDALIEPFGPTGWLVANISYRVVESPVLGDSFVAAFANAHIDTITVSPVPVPPAFLLFVINSGPFLSNSNPIDSRKSKLGSLSLPLFCTAILRLIIIG